MVKRVKKIMEKMGGLDATIVWQRQCRERSGNKEREGRGATMEGRRKGAGGESETDGVASWPGIVAQQVTAARRYRQVLGNRENRRKKNPETTNKSTARCRKSQKKRQGRRRSYVIAGCGGPKRFVVRLASIAMESRLAFPPWPKSPSLGGDDEARLVYSINGRHGRTILVSRS
ncbi:hypothetical protein BO94DRAFT_40522 [Aspergillus sclerotioniger CBS 115572]|uniref:Uncharacterized protein n=1 Tax=Aspergillus sclerotioniger CBS 115572 TaxID=1450535 RepID=A0A317WXN9_9EURO|nr:hypothetical protein BO94DRAFT_40522 [Aspergillus sclerotioniger CBS 115572]PWY89548.1 hypothetical protein BO94DRAFT_40522 [Aspergillus sclerotioniger CBS 115572]